MTALIGPSECGKSTFLRSITHAPVQLAEVQGYPQSAWC